MLASLYSPVLFVHSWLRWAVLLIALLVVVRAMSSRWTPADDRRMFWFVTLVDLQMVLGLFLYVALSPATQEAFKDFGAAMRTGSLRFWAVEHITGMVIAVALAHVGRVRVKKSADPDDKRRRALLFTGLSLAAMVLSIPWPGLPNGRALFRFGM